MPKYTLRIPCAESYAYLETVFEGEAHEAVEEYRRLTTLVKGGDGLDDKEWRQIVDTYMVGNAITPEQFEKMNERQSWFVHEIDKYVARQKYVNPKGEVHHSLQ